MFRRLERIAAALERIAAALEQGDKDVVARTAAIAAWAEQQPKVTEGDDGLH